MSHTHPTGRDTSPRPLRKVPETIRTAARSGFSLMEVNMAVFIMAIGIMGMVALFPLGLREGIQGRADLKQAMFADHALNQLVATLSQTNMAWSDWVDLDHTVYPRSIPGQRKLATFPTEVSKHLDLLGRWRVGGEAMKPEYYLVTFDLVPGASSRLLGIGVCSTEVAETDYSRYTNNVLYYAEVLFQGDPMK